MKKKFLAIYALTGALVASPVFTSCVDDNESASVTAIRNAKAEQLKALTAVSNAQAESILIAANADKAVKEAQAEYQKALAAAEQAEADQIAAETERAKQEFAAKLEAIKAQAEKDMWQAKLSAAQFEQQFNDLADERVKQLYNQYQGEVAILEGYFESQLRLNDDLARLQNELVSTEEFARITKERNEKEIKEIELQIKLYQEYGDNSVELAELKEKLAKATLEKEKLDKASTEAYNAYQTAEETYKAEYDTYDFYASATSSLAVLKAVNTLNSINGNLTTSEEKTLTENVDFWPYGRIQVYALNNDQVPIEKARLESYIRDFEINLGAPATPATETEAAVEASGLYKEIENYKENIADQEKNIAEWKKQLEENPDQTWVQNQIDNALDNIQRWNNSISDIENIRIPEAKLSLNEAKANLTAFEAAVKSFEAEGEDWKAYEAAIAAITESAKTFDTVFEAYEEADDAYQAKANEWSALSRLVNSMDLDVAAEILGMQEDITYLKKEIQDMQNGISDKNVQIAIVNERLKTIATQIEAQKAIIANIEEAIKAAIGEEEA